MVNKNRFAESFVLLIFIILLIETYFAPRSVFTVRTGSFPAVKIMGFTFIFSEIVIFCFIYICIIYLVIRTLITKKINIGPKPFIPFILIFAVSLSLSILIGAINLNEKLLTHFRMMIYTLSLYIIFLNINISDAGKRNIFNILFISSMIFTLINFIRFFYLEFCWFIPTHFANIYTLTFSVLLFNISFARIIYKGFNLFWFILILLSSLAVVVHLSKTIVFSLFVSIVSLLLIGFLQNRLNIRLKQIFYIVLIFTFISILVLQLPQDIKDSMISKIKYSYLNIGRGTAEEDLSTGRFTIWKVYLSKSIYGFGLAPQGFAHTTIIEVFDENYIDIGEHNIIVYYAYHGGYISAISLIILIIMFIFKGFKTSKKIDYCKNLLFKKYEIVGIFSFIISQVAINMTGLRLSFVRTAWIFWFLLTLLLKEWSKADYFFKTEKLE